MYSILTADTETMKVWLGTFLVDLDKLERKLAAEKSAAYRKGLRELVSYTRSDVDAIKATLRSRGEHV